MSDSSDEDVYVEIPYSKRPEWSDIKPIPQDNDTNDIVRIAYTECFEDVFSYFRAILKLNEKSERAFELSKDAAMLNPANYTVWYYRRLLIKELDLSLNDELTFITTTIRSNPKNYQVWQHRRNIIELLNDPSQELQFTEQILKKDSKNYHAWQYRQSVIKQFKLWQNELEFIDYLISKDIRNNSAWNQRYFLISNTNDLNASAASEVLNREVDYCLEKIQKCIDNESSWNYLRGLINHLTIISSDNGISAYPQKVLDFCNATLASPKQDDKSPFLVAFLVDYNMIKAKQLKKDLAENPKQDDLSVALTQLVSSSIEYLASLGEVHDRIRSNYWNYLIARWKQEFADYL